MSRVHPVVLTFLSIIVLGPAAVAQSTAKAMVAEPTARASFAPKTGETEQIVPASPATTNSGGNATTANPQLRIGKGNLLDVGVYGQADYQNEVRVGEDGAIVLPLVGSMQVAGMTPTELSKQLRAKLMEGDFYKDPQVSVFVKEYATEGISVLGEVSKPGIYPLLGPRTLFDAISAAQGTTPTASDKVTITHRDNPNPETVKLIYGANGIQKSDVRVYPGDTIVVQKAGMTYVIGAVTKPTEIVMANPNLTVLQAIAIAQGPTPDASLNKAKLVRTTDGARKETSLPLKDMLSGKSADVTLQANDIVYIPGALARPAAKKGLATAIQTISGLAVYGHF